MRIDKMSIGMIFLITIAVLILSCTANYSGIFHSCSSSPKNPNNYYTIQKKSIETSTVPSEPLNLHGTFVGLNVILTWDLPISDGGSQIVSYNIYRGNKSGSESLLVNTWDILAYNDIVPKEGIYYYKVSAVNKIGEGKESNEISVNVTKSLGTCIIRGRVIDSENKTIIGVTVLLRSTDGLYRNETKTDNNGRYIFTNLPINKMYVISVILRGHRTYTSQPISGEPGMVKENDIKYTFIESPSTIFPYILIGCVMTLGLTGLFAGIILSEVVKFSIYSIFFVPLYTRLRREQVLDRFVRGQVYAYIRMNPGTHYSALRDRLHLKNGTLTHHLRILEMQGFIKSSRDGVLKRFYQIGVKPEDGQGIRHSKLQIKIINAIKTHKGYCQADLAKELNIPSSVLNYNVKMLVRVGTIRIEKVGKKHICYINNLETANPLDIASV